MTTKLKALLPIAALAAASAFAQGPQDPATLMAAQRDALKVFDRMDGVWRGPAWTLQPNGEKRQITQTERIGPFLGGSVKVIEGRGYKDDGSVGFNAFGIVSYDPAKKAYTIRSYALGRMGDFPFAPNADGGYDWETPGGPNAVIKYHATIRDGTLHEVGDRIVEGREPLRVFEMTLKRVGDTDWPAGSPIPPR